MRVAPVTGAGSGDRAVIRSGPANRLSCGVRRDDDFEDKNLAKHLLADAPFSRRYGGAPLPRLGISKREGYEKCGILVPNPRAARVDLR